MKEGRKDCEALIRIFWACLKKWARWTFRPEKMTRGQLGPFGQKAEEGEPDKVT